jgi:hypothetical protein
VHHIVPHANGVVLVDVALGHHFVYRANNVQDATAVPWQGVDRGLELSPLQLAVLVGVKVLPRTESYVLPRQGWRTPDLRSCSCRHRSQPRQQRRQTHTPRLPMRHKRRRSGEIE